MVKRNRTRPRLKVSADGQNVVNHAGARLLSDLADETGLRGGLSRAMAATKQRRGGHDRGQVLVDLAVMIADGGDAISDLAVLRNQPDLFGEVASTPTAWRTLEAVDGDALDGIAVARAEARRRVWAAGADPGFYVIDFDGTLITAHSDKESSAPTYKRGFGHHPLLALLDGTGEALAGILRPGNAASNTTADHVDLLAMALAQLPVDPETVEVVARADSAALTHGFVDACRDAHVRFSVGFDLTEPVRTACLSVPKRRWQPAVTADGSDEREGADVAEITDLIDLSRWPEGTRAIARREEPHPGAQLTFTDADGHRFQVFITDQPTPTSPTSKPSNAAEVEPRSSSATSRTPVSATCHPPTCPSTPPGSPRPSSPTTYSPGPNWSASTTTSPAPNPNGCATACYTPPARSPAAGAAPGSVSPPPGPGPPILSPRSTRSASSACRPESQIPRPPASHTLTQPDNTTPATTSPSTRPDTSPKPRHPTHPAPNTARRPSRPPY